MAEPSSGNECEEDSTAVLSSKCLFEEGIVVLFLLMSHNSSAMDTGG